MPSSFILPRFTQVDAYGNPLVGGRLYTYANGTTTPQTTYKDAAGTIANTNPIILDSLGSAVIFLTEGIVYTFVMKDANDALVWSQDSVSGAQTNGGSISVVTTLPASDIGPVYVMGQGIFTWNGATYVSDYQGGFSGGCFAFKNKLNNGSFRIWQSGTTVGPITSASSNPITADRWRATISGSASITVTKQSVSTDFGQGKMGAFACRITSNAAVTPAAGDKNRFSQGIEGQNMLNLAMGTLWGGSFTLSFWVKASIAGTYSVAFLNAGSPSFRSYVANFTVVAAGAYEFKQITVPIDSSGITSWSGDNTLGMRVVFDLGSGSSSEGAANTWLSTETTRTTGSVRVIGTNAATFEVGQIQLEFGSQPTPFEDRPITTELQLCQRYLQVTQNDTYIWCGNTTTGTNYYLNCPLLVTMRATPTVLATVASAQLGFPTSFSTTVPLSPNAVSVSKTASSTVNGGYFYAGLTVSAEF